MTASRRQSLLRSAAPPPDFGRRSAVSRLKRPRRRRGAVLARTVLARAGRFAGALYAMVLAVSVIAVLARLTGVWSASEAGADAVALQPAPTVQTSVETSQVQPIAPPPPAAAAAEPIAEPVAEPAAAPAAPPPLPDWRRYAAAAPAADGRGRVVVVIDDLGLDRAAAARLAATPGPLTLAFLPYARDLPAQAQAARAAGHELLVHLPMEPKARRSDPGPMALAGRGGGQDGGRDGGRELLRRLDWNLSRFSGFVGINNHMGSRLTEDRAAMDLVMGELAARGLLFLDSRTTAKSVAAAAAAGAGVPHAVRHVFLDNERSAGAIAARLGEVEELARRDGLAIAIGHPHPATLDALAAWLATLDAKGLTLAPLSAAVTVPAAAARQARAAGSL